LRTGGALPPGGGVVTGAVTLVEGNNSIAVSATDGSGRTGIATVAVLLDMIPVKTRLEGANVAMLLPPREHGVELRVPGGNAVPVECRAAYLGDRDGDGVPEVTLTFDRRAVIRSIRAGIAARVIVLRRGRADVVLTVVADGVVIASDTVRVKG
jgi:hypothetical protein